MCINLGFAGQEIYNEEGFEISLEHALRRTETAQEMLVKFPERSLNWCWINRECWLLLWFIIALS